MKKSIKEWLHYFIVWAGVWLGIYLFMIIFPPTVFDTIYMIKTYLVGQVVFIVLDKLAHKYFIKEA